MAQTLADVQAKARAILGANSAGSVDKFRLLELLDLLVGGSGFSEGGGFAYATALTGRADSGAASVVTTRFVRVTANANDTNDWIVLPPALAGMEIWGWSVPAHEIRTPASSGETINGQDSDGTKEAAIPATTLWNVICVTDGAWILRAWDELAAPITAIVPD